MQAPALVTDLPPESCSEQTLRLCTLAECPVCEHVPSRPQYTIRDLLHGIAGEFQYVLCDSCRSVYQNPRVADDDLAACYPAEYYTHTAPPGNALPVPADHLRGIMRRVVLRAADGVPADNVSLALRLVGRFIARFPPIRRRARYGLPDSLSTEGRRSPHVLEVGPGMGEALAALRLIGWHAVGLDMDPRAAAVARRRSGCEVRVGTLATCGFAPNSFDAIYMTHVLEHLPDLQDSLRRCFELLSPGGRLICVYPNPHSLGVKCHRGFSPNLDPPRHLVLPSASAVQQLLTRIGFVNATVRTSSRRAGSFRCVARRYRMGIQPAFGGRGSWGDLAFHAVEAALVMFGVAVGEEILVSAQKHDVSSGMNGSETEAQLRLVTGKQ